MSPDEYEKRLRRRQQNRRAARKFREKKKMHAQGIIQVRGSLSTSNALNVRSLDIVAFSSVI